MNIAMCSSNGTFYALNQLFPNTCSEPRTINKIQKVPSPPSVNFLYKVENKGIQNVEWTGFKAFS